ncbi:MAG: hypothetical protein R6T98_00065, partial [Desulfatiglandales bacterium]
GGFVRPIETANQLAGGLTPSPHNTQRPLKNPAIFTILKKTMDFFEVTGGRVLSFRNVSVGEPAGPDKSGSEGHSFA